MQTTKHPKLIPAPGVDIPFIRQKLQNDIVPITRGDILYLAGTKPRLPIDKLRHKGQITGEQWDLAEAWRRDFYIVSPQLTATKWDESHGCMQGESERYQNAYHNYTKARGLIPLILPRLICISVILYDESINHQVIYRRMGKIAVMEALLVGFDALEEVYG